MPPLGVLCAPAPAAALPARCDKIKQVTVKLWTKRQKVKLKINKIEIDYDARMHSWPIIQYCVLYIRFSATHNDLVGSKKKKMPMSGNGRKHMQALFTLGRCIQHGICTAIFRCFEVAEGLWAKNDEMIGKIQKVSCSKMYSSNEQKKMAVVAQETSSDCGNELRPQCGMLLTHSLIR